jgi:hypothetical protein
MKCIKLLQSIMFLAIIIVGNSNEVFANELRHLVAIKFKEGVTQEKIEEISASFYKLPESISAIKDFEWGLNDSPENFHQGFTHIFMLTFKSEKDRDVGYTEHPSHKAFVEKLVPNMDKVFVVDYWTK